MNFLDALKTGKEICTEDREQWVETWEETIVLDRATILRDDWVVHEKKIEITLSQLHKAWDMCPMLPRAESCRSLRRLEVELGFREDA